MLKNVKLVSLFFMLVIVLVRKEVNSYVEEENQPIYLTVKVGHYVLLDCDVDFPQNMPIPYMIKWKKDGKTIFSWNKGVTTEIEPYVGRIHLLDEYIEEYGKASINITSIRENDGGWFECRVLFPNRIPSSRNNGTWYYVTVNGGNVLAIPPINQTVLEGEEAQFTCAPKEQYSTVTWYKDGVSVAELTDLTQRSWISKDGTLIIHPTSMSDLGEYSCEAINIDGESQRARAFLNVQYKAKVIYSPREVYLPYGKPAVLDCHFRANPPLTTLRWEKDGFLYDPYNVPGVFYRRNGSLYFSSVDESHNGYYSCTPFNELGTNGPSPNIRVIVLRPPVFVITPNNLYIRKLGETLEMPCDARDGEKHKPIIIWYKKDGSSLPVGRYTINEGNLTIVNIHEEDRGTYLCSATNEAATITAEAELVVENLPPNTPYNLSAIAHATSVHLKWSAATHRQHSEYSIWYKTPDTKEWKTVRISNKRKLETTVTGLNPGREYEFVVLSQDKHGNGLFSKSIRVHTKGIEAETDHFKRGSFSPVGFPKNVTLHRTVDGYLVTWEPPEYGLENLKYYRVKWTQAPDDYLYGSGETRNTSYLITGLEEGYDYDIEVLAVSTDGQETRTEKMSLNLPGYAKTKTVSTAIIASSAFIAVAAIGVYFARKKWRRRQSSEKYQENQNDKK